MPEKCYECGEVAVEDIDEDDVGNPAPDEVHHYECGECGAYYTVSIGD